MSDVGFFKTNHNGPKLREVQPLRHLAAKYAAFGFRSHRAAFAGDDEHEGQALGMGALQEARQGAVGAQLRHAVQIEPGIDLLPAA